MEPVTLNTTDTGILNTFKFAVLQKMSIEYFMAIEDSLVTAFELEVSTKYKHRFTANAKEKRKIEKQMAEEVKTFKARFRAYKQKNMHMWEMLDSFRHGERDSIEKCVEQVYEYIDELILKKDG